MKSGVFQIMTRDIWPSVCLCTCVCMCLCFCSSSLFCLTCFRGNFSGGTSAKDKGHWGHREWFLCSSGFQIIQGWYKGAFCHSLSPCPSLSLSFHSVSYWISLSAVLGRLSRDSPDQIKHSYSAPFVPTWDGFISRSTVLHLQSGSTHTKATAGNSHHLPPSLSLSLSPFWLCRCRKNIEVIIEMFLSLKEQELDLLRLMAVLKRQATTCDSKATQTFGTHLGEYDKGQDPCGWTKPASLGLDRLQIECGHHTSHFLSSSSLSHTLL